MYTITLSDEQLREILDRLPSYDDRMKDFAQRNIDWDHFHCACAKYMTTERILAGAFAIGFEMGRTVCEVQELARLAGLERIESE